MLAKRRGSNQILGTPKNVVLGEEWGGRGALFGFFTRHWERASHLVAHPAERVKGRFISRNGESTTKFDYTRTCQPCPSNSPAQLLATPGAHQGSLSEGRVRHLREVLLRHQHEEGQEGPPEVVEAVPVKVVPLYLSRRRHMIHRGEKRDGCRWGEERVICEGRNIDDWMGCQGRRKLAGNTS